MKGLVTMSRMRIGCLATAGLLLCATTGRATTVIAMTQADLVRQSALIVEARAVANRVVHDEGPDGPVNVRTLTTFEVSQTLKGDHQRTITVVGYGGVVGDKSYNWPGVPRFQVGETALLFLTRHPAGELTVTGLEQGRMTISEKPGIGRVAIQTLYGVELVGPRDRLDTPGEKPLVEVVNAVAAEVRAQQAAAEQKEVRP
jgi:hypothetical protein